MEDVEAAHGMTPDLSRAFAVLLEDTLRRCDQTARDLDELGASYGGGLEQRSYHTFINALQLVNQTARSYLESRREAFDKQDDPKTRESLYSLVRNVAFQLAERLESQVQLLRLPRSEQLDVFATPMTRLAKRMLPNAELLFLPWTVGDGYRLDTYNGSEAERLSPGLRRNLERAYGAEIEFLKLRYPSARREDLFQHAVFAHEIAHAVIRQPIPGSPAAEAHDPKRPTYFSQAARAAPTGLAEPQTRLLDWLTELACDVVAMRLVGPAFAVAFAEVTAANRTIEGGAEFKRHPHPSVRFAVLDEELARFDLGAAGRPLRLALRDYLKSHEGTDPQPTPSPGAKNWLDEALERFRGPMLTDMLGGGEVEYTPKQLAEDLPEVLRLAELGVPPCERITAFEAPGREDEPGIWSREIDWRSVLNGVLLRFLTTHGTPSVCRNAARDRDRTRATRLALGAIELAEFQRQARALRAQVHDLRVEEMRA
ncbi:MAG: hypothetical protein QOK16_4749 [Solirubrobacteraceae bacterium]|nr:hypothetical protein [Solirubrobacteraceae bacterium]